MPNITMTENDIMFCIFLAGVLSTFFICLICDNNKMDKQEKPKQQNNNKQPIFSNYRQYDEIEFCRNYDEVSDIVGFNINHNEWDQLLDNQDMLDPLFDRWLRNILLDRNNNMEEALSSLTNKELSMYCDAKYKTKNEMVHSIMMRLQSTRNANIEKKLQRLRRMLE